MSKSGRSFVPSDTILFDVDRWGETVQTGLFLASFSSGMMPDGHDASLRMSLISELWFIYEHRA